MGRFYKMMNIAICLFGVLVGIGCDLALEFAWGDESLQIEVLKAFIGSVITAGIMALGCGTMRYIEKNDNYQNNKGKLIARITFCEGLAAFTLTFMAVALSFFSDLILKETADKAAEPLYTGFAAGSRGIVRCLGRGLGIFTCRQVEKQAQCCFKGEDDEEELLKEIKISNDA
jgi:hypothetical protein